MAEERITEGVKCVVNTCSYYKEGDLCTAGKIEIRPRNAKSSDETDCATFEPDSFK
ncbi:MAG: DUF1540 domain-containing protein [Tissierellia bacterium]|nr:DUF1540 domain-containing protein [Tissierellia bacterium]